MKIVNLSQRSPEWLAWRAQGVTASEAAAILGRSPYQTPWRLWAEKTGLCAPPDLSQNPFVQRGIQCEDRARRGFEDRHQTWLLPVCAESERHPVLRCSFDGLTESGEPVELKIPGQKTWDAVAREQQESLAYRLYWVQVQFQCYVAEAERGWLVFDPVRSGVHPLEFEILRDADFIERELIPACLRFAEMIATGQAPLPDPVRDRYVPQGDQQIAWQRQAHAWRTAEAEGRRLEAALKGVKARLSEAQSGLVQLMGEYLLADRDGVQVLRYRQRGSVDYPAVLEAIAPDLDPQVLEAHRRPSTTRVKVTLEARAEEGAATEGAQSVEVNPNPASSPPKGRRRQGVTSAAVGSAHEADIVFGYF
ncbi:phage-type endonuclease [Thiorhodococcus drewsii AZ1]|uniref:Phage-type endonuclease n=1 Tax=Thiorhodococcus drewsii AZ1 TaxID=765913 RepID=G2E6X2_9GAMM|nr:YqaJ viral recombinase family protein [Thiorhodococcus drewsii]EGV28134.1 phage-type endonuclease [Thiorhodococcus drewsii AZ1]